MDVLHDGRDGLARAQACEGHVGGEAGPFGVRAAVAVGGGAQRVGLEPGEGLTCGRQGGPGERAAGREVPTGGAEVVLAVGVVRADGGDGAAAGGGGERGAVEGSEACGPVLDV